MANHSLRLPLPGNAHPKAVAFHVGRAVCGSLAILALSGCFEVVSKGIQAERRAAGVPALAVKQSVAEMARASATRMCVARDAAPAADPLAAYGEPTIAAVHELAVAAPLDPAIAKPSDRNRAAST